MHPVRHGLCLAGVLALAAVGCQPAFAAQQVKLAREVQSGVKTGIAHERSWNRATCVARKVEVIVTRMPAHGSLTLVDDMSQIPATVPRIGSTGPCAGRSVSGKRIEYQSAPGFVGEDHVSWRATYDGRVEGETDFTLRVR